MIDMTLGELRIGDTAAFSRVITKEDIAAFAVLSGDTNPLHTNETYAATTRFKQPIVHGMFLGALCSTLIGVYLPGKRSLYLSQELFFKHPVYAGEDVRVTGTITAKSESTRIITLAMTIDRAGQTVMTGTARVQVRE